MLVESVVIPINSSTLIATSANIGPGLADDRPNAARHSEVQHGRFTRAIVGVIALLPSEARWLAQKGLAGGQVQRRPVGGRLGVV